jgi:hypothetical protein
MSSISRYSTIQYIEDRKELTAKIHILGIALRGVDCGKKTDPFSRPSSIGTWLQGESVQQVDD